MATVTAVWKQGMNFEAESPGGKITLDAGPDLGGKGQGNRSKPLMLVALAGCTGMDVLSILTKMKISVNSFSVEVKAQAREEHPRIYIKTHILYRVLIDPVNKEKFGRAVELSFTKYCGVVAMFQSFSEVTREIVFAQRDGLEE